MIFNSQHRRRLLIIGTLSIFLFLFFALSSTHISTTWNRNTVLPADGKPNAAIVILVPPSRMTRAPSHLSLRSGPNMRGLEAMMALLNIEDRFNRRLKYPYVLLTEGSITLEMQEKVNWITEGRATFGMFSLVNY